MIHKTDCWHLGINERLNATINLKIVPVILNN